MAYRFGPFQLDPRTGTLNGPEGPIPLRRQAFRLAEVLLEHAPDLLDHNTLLDRVWGRTALSPNALPQTISELRHALGDDAHHPRFIETVHRRGYRVVCAVERVQTRPSHEGQDSAGALDPTGPGHLPPCPRSTGPAGGILRAGAMLLAVGLVVASTPSPPTGADSPWHGLHVEAIPRIRTLLEDDVFAAYRVAREVRGEGPMDPTLEQLWLDLSLPVDIGSDPEGAQIAIRAYHGEDADWVVLGHTPLRGERLPLTMMRMRARLPGYGDVEIAPGLLPSPETIRLHPPEATPDGMVYVPPGPVEYLGVERTLPGFWIGRHEVSNREFKAFIDAGGYARASWWRAALEASASPSLELLTEPFVDSTGHPGPATWEHGRWPEGAADHPVEGISWFEAAAFAEFSGAQLPSVFQWWRAAGLGTAQAANFSDILVSSNFSGRGAMPVGASGGLGPYGTLDMAGNVWEWCVNPAGPGRHLLGGSWMDNRYQFSDANAMPPDERRSGFGMRLVRPSGPGDLTFDGEVAIDRPDLPHPVDAATFALLARQFDYDDAPLDARIEAVEHHDAWRRERVSFAAAYGGERVVVDILVPYRGHPPYQAIVHFPGGDALMLDTIDDAGLLHVDPFLRSGRVVVYPVYKGTFQRRGEPLPGPIAHRDLIIQQVKDLRRTLDYLGTRPDIDPRRLAYHGLSYGGWRGAYALAMEDRFAAAMLVSAGITPRALPADVQLQDYLPRVTLPVLMLNGADDFTFPLQASQRVFFERLGTPTQAKRHVVLDWGHLPPGYARVSRELLDWADAWLGPVEDTRMAQLRSTDRDQD